MSIGIIGYLKDSVIGPITRQGEAACCTAKSLRQRAFDIGSAAFSIVGNWPFYGVADSFGKQYSAAFGSLLGASEFATYSLFRMQNFQELVQKFRQNPPQNETVTPASPYGLNAEETEVPTPRCSWKQTAIKASALGLGILAQLPFIVLTYYENDGNLFYPIATGACEGVFTVLSLLMSFQSTKKDPSAETLREAISTQCDHFLENLPEKYKDPAFTNRLEEIFSLDSLLTEDERSTELLKLIQAEKPEPQPPGDKTDKILSITAKVLGALIAGYVTVANGAVTYRGVKSWSDQEALAVAATTLVSLSNVHLVGKLCIDSAKNYYEGIRDIIKGTYRPPLAHAMSPKLWTIGRVASTALAWFSFGTTAISVRDYIPVAGNALIALAPISSALLLRESLNQGSDQLVLWGSSKHDAAANRFVHLHNGILGLKNRIETATLQELRSFAAESSQLPNDPQDHDYGVFST